MKRGDKMTSDRKKWLITATPPTSNGDLHVGHLSGPYLAADIFRRAQIELGGSARFVSFGDDNQSYIVTTAERLKTEPRKLLSEGNASIQATLSAFSIKTDSYKEVDDAHIKFIQGFFQGLFRAGVFYEKEVEMFFDPDKGRFLFESYIQGGCPVCLSLTKGGICEDCGHPNNGVDLICPTPVGDSRRIEVKKTKRFFLNLDDYREVLTNFYAEKRGKWRPHIVRLASELLSKPTLGQFPVSHPTNWGAPVGLPGWDGHVWNAMAEMGPGLLHSFRGLGVGDEELEEATLVQFLGYDNSFFFGIINICLQFAARKCGLPTEKQVDWIITNEFYYLDNSKFSTSKLHAIWGRELLKYCSVDEARFYIALNAPELSESNFILAEMQAYVDREIRAKMQAFMVALKEAGPQLKAATWNETSDRLEGVNQRFRSYYSPSSFSIRESAKLLKSLMEFLMSRLPVLDLEGDDKEILAELGMLATFSAPIVPTFSDGLKASLSNLTERNDHDVKAYAAV